MSTPCHEQPPDSLPEFIPASGEDWIVVRTMARCEKKLHAYCQQIGLFSYLPLRRSIRRYQRRVVEFYIPIFPGYLFMRMPLTMRGQVDESRHVASIIVPDAHMQIQLIRELNDLRIVEQATRHGDMVVRPEIETGKSVIIQAGPFAGVHGIVSKRRKQTRLAVNIEMIGQSVSVELDVAEVEIDW